MNLVLFESHELSVPLARADRRALHLVNVLKRKCGDSFDAGLVNGPRGKGTITELTEQFLSFEFRWTEPPATAATITVLVGLPRPQTARDILRDATSLGVEALHFVMSEKGDSNYASSTLWSTGEWRRHVITGAEQAFSTQLPAVTFGTTQEKILTTLPSTGTRLALDNYESPVALSQLSCILPPVTLALGSERGWSAADRNLLRENDFAFVHLGERVLRTETACIAAITLVRGKLGLM